MAQPSYSEIRVPFQVGPNGGIGFTHDPVEQARQHVLSAVTTGIGERVMRYEYGTPIYASLFEPDDPATAAGLVAEMTRAIQEWVPEVQVVGISIPDDTPSNGLVVYNVSFRLKGVNSAVHEAEVLIGGTVIERTAQELRNG